MKLNEQEIGGRVKVRLRHGVFTGNASEIDAAAVRSVIERSKATEFFRDRKVRNVALPPPEFSRDELWRVLLGCLLTTRQRATKGSPVNLFMDRKPFLLALGTCKKEPSVRRFVLKTIRSYRGIRFGPKISRFAAENWKRLDKGSGGKRKNGLIALASNAHENRAKEIFS